MIFFSAIPWWFTPASAAGKKIMILSKKFNKFNVD